MNTSAMPYGLKRMVGGRRMHMHRIIAERVVGRPLPRTVQVHHVDEDKSNFSHSNLVICENATYHQLLHTRAKVVRAGGDPNTQRMCSRCDRVLPTEAFASRAARPCGRSPWCRACKAEYHQQTKAVA